MKHFSKDVKIAMEKSHSIENAVFCNVELKNRSSQKKLKIRKKELMRKRNIIYLNFFDPVKEEI